MNETERAGAGGTWAVAALLLALFAPVWAEERGAVPSLALGEVRIDEVPSPAHLPRQPGCTLRPYRGEPLPGYEYDWYGTPADVRAGATCVFPVHSDLPHFVFELQADREANRFSSVLISDAEGRPVQRVELDRFVLGPVPRDGDYLRIDDIDFDGYGDVGILVEFRPLGNRLFSYWLFDPRARRFASQRAAMLSNPSTDPVAKEVVTFEDAGASGRLYTRTRWRFRDGHLVLVREETRRWVDGRYERVVREPSGESSPWTWGTLVVVQRDETRDPPDRPYDPEQWEAMKTIEVNLGAELARARAVLLRSKSVTGLSGLGSAEHDVNLVVVDRDRTVYRFREAPPAFLPDNDMRFFLTGHLVAHDVTGDGIPELEFAAGYVGASNVAVQRHILRYDRARRSFRDIAHSDWGEDTLTKLHWLRIDGALVALLASPIWGEGECHYCAHHYEYGAYCWNAPRGVFVRFYRGKSRKPYGENGLPREALKTVRGDIRASIEGACAPDRPAACARAPGSEDPRRDVRPGRPVAPRR